jgi:integrase
MCLNGVARPRSLTAVVSTVPSVRRRRNYSELEFTTGFGHGGNGATWQNKRVCVGLRHTSLEPHDDLAMRLTISVPVSNKRGARRRTRRPAHTAIDAWGMIRRLPLVAGIEKEIGCHTFRATGITAYLKNGGKLAIVQQMAAMNRRAPLASMIAAAMRSNVSGFDARIV